MRDFENINEYFSRMCEFTSIAKRHLNSNKTYEEFIVWFEKLYSIDKRLLYLYLKDNIDKLSQKEIDFAESYFKKPLLNTP